MCLLHVDILSYCAIQLDREDAANSHAGEHTAPSTHELANECNDEGIIFRATE